MQRTTRWWDSLTDEQRAEVVALPPGPLPEWVLDTMAACDMPLVTATVGDRVLRLPPTVTTDFLAMKRSDPRS